MIKRNMLCVAALSLMAAVSLTSCGQSEPAAEATTEIVIDAATEASGEGQLGNNDGKQGEKPEGQPPAKPDGENQPPEMPDGNGQPPEMPDGKGQPPEMPDGNGQPPEMPDGKGQPPEMPDGNGQPPAKPDGEGQPGGKQKEVSYTAVKTYSEDKEVRDVDCESKKADENAILVDNKAKVTLEDVDVEKEGDSDGGDATSFYGMNSAILAKDGANVVINNSEIETEATGANGIFCYGGSATTQNAEGDGTTVTISNTKIETTKDNSGGIMTTGGGIMNANDLDITTSGTSSAAIRSDRGGGLVTVQGGSYRTTGKGSPAVYSTADITVKLAGLYSEASEGVVIEGKNSVTLEEVTLQDFNKKLNGQSTTYKNIFLYQSMSGDAEEGTAVFTAKRSQIATGKGDSFYVTNTTATINLENNEIINNDEEGYFLRAQKDSWGREGENGGNVILNMTAQEAEGDIAIDEISSLEMNLKNKSTWTGKLNESNASDNIVLTLDKSSKLSLTGDCYVKELKNADSSNKNISFNGYTIFVDGKDIQQ